MRRQFGVFPWAAPSALQPWRQAPLVSVVLPVFNQSQYLAAAVNSVLRQQACPIELIVVDDGSTEDIDLVLQPFLGDGRLSLLSQENMGLAEALNAGFRLVRGSFVSWTSGDNLFCGDALSRMANFLLANPSVALAFANVELIDESGTPLRNSDYRRQDQAKNSSSQLELPLNTETLGSYPDNFINACFLFRRSFLDVVGCHHPGLLGCEDFDFWLRLSRFGRIEHIDSDDILYSYRLHKDSLTSTLEDQELALLSKKLHQKRFLEKEKEINCSIYLPPALAERSALLEFLKLLEKKSAPNFSLEIGPELTENSQQLHLVPGPFQEVTYRHASHSKYHENCNFSPLWCTKKQDVPSKFAEPQRLALLPPLFLPELLRRARDSDFQAVAVDNATRARVLVFANQLNDSEETPWDLAALTACLTEMPQLTFVLFCESPSERAFADQLNLSLEQNSNLRIIDMQNQASDPASILHLMSSVDLVLSLKGPKLGLLEVLEIRLEAALAALAGRNLVALYQPRAAGAGPFLMRAEPGSREMFFLDHELLSAPHIGFSPLASSPEQQDFRHLIVELEDTLLQAANPPDYLSLEQWLERQCWQRFSEKLAAVISLKEAASLVAL